MSKTPTSRDTTYTLRTCSSCAVQVLSCSVSFGVYCRRPQGGGRALKLGGKKDVESFVDQLKSEGERMRCLLFTHLFANRFTFFGIYSVKPVSLITCT